MQLIYLKIEEALISKNYNEGPKEMQGFVEFKGQSGKMVLPLTQLDIKNIQELLMVKTKVLAGEA